MLELHPAQALENLQNRFLSVLVASMRARQLMERAERHGMSVDIEKVLQQSLSEVVEGKVEFILKDPTSPPAEPPTASEESPAEAAPEASAGA